MVSITVDPQQQSKLREATGPVHLVNDAGQIVRVAITVEEFLRYLYKTVPISQEEVERRSKNGGGRTLDEIWKRLGTK